MGEVVDPSAERQRDSRMRAHRFQQHGLQVAAMDDPIGRVVAFGRGRAERRPRQHPRRLRVPDPKLLRSDHEGLQPRAEAEGEQNARGIGRKLQARAGLFQTLRLVEHSDGESSLRERQRRRQAADARAGDDDPARGTPLFHVSVAATANAVHPIRQRALGRSRRMRVEGGIVAEQRGAIGAYDLGGVAHVQVDVGMIERRHLALAHELARADLDHRDPGGVVEVRNDPVRHAVRPLWCVVPVGSAETPRCRAARRNKLHGERGGP